MKRDDDVFFCVSVLSLLVHSLLIVSDPVLRSLRLRLHCRNP